jgi:hypothetical protein
VLDPELEKNKKRLVLVGDLPLLAAGLINLF